MVSLLESHSFRPSLIRHLADLPDIPDDDDSSMSMHQGMSNHRNNNNNSSNSSHYNNNNNSSSSHYNNNNSHTTTTSTIHLAPPRPRRLWKVNDTALRPFPLYAPAPSSQCVRLIPHTPPSVVAIRIAECLRRRSVAVEYDDEAAVATCVTVDRCHFTLFLWAASDKHTLRLVSSSHHHTTRQQQQQRQQQQRQQQQRQRSSTSATTSTTAASASSFSLLPANSLLLTNDAIWVEGMRQRGSLVTFHRTLQAVFHAAASYATGAEDHDDDDIVVDDDNDDNDDHDVDSTLDNNNSSNNNNNPLPRPRLYRYHGPTGRRLFQSSPLEYPRLQAMSKTTTTTFNLGMEQHTTASIDGAAGAGGADHHHYRYNGSAATTYLHPAKQPKKTTNHDLATTNNTTTNNNNNNNNHHPNTIMESSSFSSLFFSHADRTRLLPLPTMHASRVSAQAYQALEHIGHLLRKDRCEAQWLGMQQLVALTDPFASGVDTAMYAALAVLGAPIVMEYDDDNDDGDNNNNNNHHHHHGNKSNNNNNKPSSPPRDASLPREIHQQWIVRLLTDRLLPGEWPSLATTINQHTTTSSSQDVSGVAPPNTSFSFSCVQSLFGVGSHDRGDHPNNNHSLDVTTEPQPLDDDQDVTVGDEHHGGGLRSMALRALCNALTLLEDQQPHILKSVLQVQSPQLSQAPLIQALLDDVAGCSRPPAVIFGTRLASPHEAALAVRCLRILGAHSPTAKRRMLLPTSHHHIPVTVLLLDKARMVGQSTHQVLAHEANQAYHELTEDFRSC